MADAGSPGARAAVVDWLREANVKITLVDCVYGSRSAALSDLSGPRVTHIEAPATTMAWTKENLLNLGIFGLPREAEKIATLDADVPFRRDG